MRQRGDAAHLVVLRDERRRAEDGVEMKIFVHAGEPRVMARDAGVRRPGERAEHPERHERRAKSDVGVDGAESDVMGVEVGVETETETTFCQCLGRFGFDHLLR